MIARARAAGIPFSWVAGDDVYGGNPGLRARLEDRAIPYVMAVACSDIVPMAAGGMQADEADDLVPRDGWQRLGCADGSKGPGSMTGRSSAPRKAPATPARPPLPAARREGKARAGVLPLLIAAAGHAARDRRGRRRPLGNRGLLRRGEGRDRTGPLPSPQVPGLVPARHPGNARARCPRRRRQGLAPVPSRACRRERPAGPR